jgi:predicted DNA-binding protein with PD1-like motif
MVYTKVDDGFLVRLEKGELIVSTLTQFCIDKNIKSGVVSGVGGATWAELAFYDLEQRAYEYEKHDELLEITSISGNVSVVADKSFVHLHATMADSNYHSYGGHLKEAEVAATCEVYIRQFSKPINRIHNEEVGLKILDI